MRALIGVARRARSVVSRRVQLERELAGAKANCEALLAEVATLARERDEALKAEKTAQRATCEALARANTAARAAHVADQAAAAAVREAQWGGWRAERAQFLRNLHALEDRNTHLQQRLEHAQQELDKLAARLVEREAAHA